MNCAACGSPIPDKLLACRPCLERKAFADAITHQREFIPGILEGALPLRLSRRGASGLFHLELYGTPNIAYCSEPMHTLYKFRERQFYTSAIRKVVCVPCLKVLDKLIADLQEVSVGDEGDIDR